MNRFLAAGVMIVLGVGIAAAQPASPVAQAVIGLENQWTVAAKAGDGSAIGALLADDFVAMDSDGTLHTKAEVVARSNKAKWANYAIGEMKATAHGDSVIVTGTWTGNGTDGNGKAVSGKERWADTWVKMANGKWQCVLSASAPSK
jgi:ketosteroid isomerase-like protein